MTFDEFITNINASIAEIEADITAAQTAIAKQVTANATE